MSETIVHVAVDIGCIECGEPSTVIGVYSDVAHAETALDAARDVQRKNWHGQHDFTIYERSVQ